MSNMALVTPDTWDMMKGQAAALIKSNFLPEAIKTPEQALAIMLTGRELGLPAMASFRMIDVIKGVVAPKPQLMLALLHRSGQLEDMTIDDDGETCTVTMKRKGISPHTEEFSMEDAKRLQLAVKYNWQQMPATMRKWRAIAACARVVFPDVILGLYTTEELGAVVDEEGEIVETETSEKPPAIAIRPVVITPEPVESAEVGEAPVLDTPPPEIASPAALLKWVNMQEPMAYYNALPHLLKAIQQELELETPPREVKTWPASRDAEGWAEFGRMAVRHARKRAKQA